MRFQLSRSLLLGCVLLGVASSGFAQQPSEAEAIRAEVSKLRQELEALEARLATLEGAQQAQAQNPAAAPEAPPAPPAAAAVPPPLPDDGLPTAAAKVVNPAMAVLANFLRVARKNPKSDQPSLDLSEVETAFQAVVDPYARADFFVSISPHAIDVEEGYITFTALRHNLLLKAGKMREAFGR